MSYLSWYHLTMLVTIVSLYFFSLVAVSQSDAQKGEYISTLPYVTKNVISVFYGEITTHSRLRPQKAMARYERDYGSESTADGVVNPNDNAVKKEGAAAGCVVS